MLRNWWKVWICEWQRPDEDLKYGALSGTFYIKHFIFIKGAVKKCDVCPASIKAEAGETDLIPQRADFSQ